MTSMWRLALFLIGTLIASTALAQMPVPLLQHRVTDLTHTLDREQRSTLESQVKALEQRKGSQIAVLIVPTTGEESIEAYATRVFDSWKLGRKDINDGVLLLVAKNDRTLRIEVGYGLEGAINDALASRIINEQITPAFKEGDFFAGIQAGVTGLSALIDGEALPEPASTGDQSEGNSLSLFSLLLFIAQFFFAPKLVKLMPFAWAKTRGFKPYISACSLLLVASLSYSLLRGAEWNLAIFFGLMAGFIGLFVYLLLLLPPGSVKFSVSTGSGSSRSSSSSSSRSSGGSGGGFGGGGGSSGGGGASGRW